MAFNAASGDQSGKGLLRTSKRSSHREEQTDEPPKNPERTDYFFIFKPGSDKRETSKEGKSKNRSHSRRITHLLFCGQRSYSRSFVSAVRMASSQDVGLSSPSQDKTEKRGT